MTHCIVTEYKYKDVKAWKDYGLPLSTPSNEAAKMVDALIPQLFGWYNDESLGGIHGTVKRIKEADPEYVLGPIVESSFQLINHTPETNSDLQASLEQIERLVKKKTINAWEFKQVEAIRQYALGYRRSAFEIWNEIVISNPFDLLSLRLAYLTGIVLGAVPDLKPVMERVLPSWTPSMNMYGYLQAMYAFVLNEVRRHEEAEKYALKSLEINPCDIWATHTRAHIMDNTNRAEEGLTFMENTENNWKIGTHLLEHNYWHLALFYIEKGDYESALSIFDDHILSKCFPGSIEAIRNGSSLLYRLQLEGVPIGRRWRDLNSFWEKSENSWIFNELHMMMSSLGAKDYESANSVLESSKEFIRKGKGSNWQATKDVGLSLCEGLMAFEKEQYENVVELFYPIQNEVHKVGGSNSQRDVFKLPLLHAAIRSSKEDHKKLAIQLIQERKECLGETGITLRIEEKLMKKLEDES